MQIPRLFGFKTREKLNIWEGSPSKDSEVSPPLFVMSAPSRKLVVAVTAGLALVLIVIGIVLWNNTPAPKRTHSYETTVKPERVAPGGQNTPPTAGDYSAPGPANPGDGQLFQGAGRTVTSMPGNFQPVATKPGETSPPLAAAPMEERDKALSQIDELKLMFRDYRTVMGENPVGTNAEIMKAITGGNPRGATLGPPEGQKLNPDGELVDRWGSPYFFHQLSSTQMEVRSAGPDKKLWTDDDLVQ